MTMKAIDFVVRDSAGGLQRGTVSGEEKLSVIRAGSGQEISLNLRQIDLQDQQRVEDDLVITLSDGRVITIDGYFNDSGAANRLFISADGYLSEIAFVEADGGNLFAQYGPTEEWGKWSPSDDLMYLGRTELVAGGYADQEVSMFAAPLLGAGLLGGGGLATAAAVGGAAVVGGGLLTGGGDDPSVPGGTPDDGTPPTTATARLSSQFQVVVSRATRSSFRSETNRLRPRSTIRVDLALISPATPSPVTAILKRTLLSLPHLARWSWTGLRSS